MQQSFVSSSVTSLSCRSSCGWETSTDSSKTSKQCRQQEETKKVRTQCVRDEEGRLLSDKGRIRKRWVRFYRSLLNAKSNMLDHDIPKRLPQHPVSSALGIEPKEKEIVTAMKAMANAEAVGPDGLPAEQNC